MNAPAAQLRLWPAPQPLVDRLGAAFFQSLPRSPGVYRIFDDAGRLIYVGKARDLHARLGSYRRTHGQSRKTIRLIHVARRIDWEVCADETSARLRENQLLRTLRPRFNRAGVWPRSARFVSVEERGHGFQLRLTAEPGGEAYGAFRAGAAFAFAALARLLWFAWNQDSTARALPHLLLREEALRVLVADHPDAPRWLPDVRSFLANGDDQLLSRLVETVPAPGSPFDHAFIAAQFEVLQDFHRRGPLRNRRLRDQLHPSATALAPEELDDLMVQADPGARIPGFRPAA